MTTYPEQDQGRQYDVGALSAVDVFAILRAGERVLLMRRAGPVPGSGDWALPSGKVEPGESVPRALVRELGEELGIACDPRDLAFSNVMHIRPPGGAPRVGFAFTADRWRGTPAIQEPQFCSALEWFPVRELPDDTFVYTRRLVAHHLAAVPFEAAGWD